MKKELIFQLKFIALWIFLVSSFLALAVFILYEANGYRLDKTNWHLELTGLISLDGQPKQVDAITINGKNVATNLPYKTKKLLPGFYDIAASKNGYTTWNKTIYLNGGQAYEDKKMFLFLTKPVLEVTTKNMTIESLTNDAKNQASIVTIKENEIWYDEELVTRFSDTPKSAILADDKLHVFFQLGSELRVIELDGSNNTKLFDLPDTETYIFTQNNDHVYYIDKEKIYEAEIR
jgi:hypothetical protein